MISQSAITDIKFPNINFAKRDVMFSYRSEVGRTNYFDEAVRQHESHSRPFEPHRRYRSLNSIGVLPYSITYSH